MHTTTLEVFRKEYEEAPQAVSSAPGVLHLFGEQVEFARGHVLSFALPMRAIVAVSRRPDQSIRIYSHTYNERKRCTVNNLKFKKEDRWANLIKGVLAGLDTMGCPVGGLNVLIQSEIPDNRGLGASSAIALAATRAFCELYNFSITPAQSVYIAHTTETQFIGRLNKVSTCYTSLLAHAGAAFTIDLRSLDYRHLRFNAPDLHFWLIDSMVPPTGAVDELKEREAAFQELRTHLKPVIGKREVRDLRVRELKELVAHLPERLRGICTHIVTEEERHHLGSDCIESTQTTALGPLLKRSHDSLREQLQFSCPELDWLSKHASSVEGVLGLRLTGRGLGACAVLLAQGEPAELEPLIKAWLGEYERIFGFQAKLRRVVVSTGERSETRLLNSGPALVGTVVEAT